MADAARLANVSHRGLSGLAATAQLQCSVACWMQGTISDMLEDVNTGIAWVLHRCAAYGGDPSRVYLVGQSCGAQLGTLALITQASALHSLPGPASSV